MKNAINYDSKSHVHNCMLSKYEQLSANYTYSGKQYVPWYDRINHITCTPREDCGQSSHEESVGSLPCTVLSEYSLGATVI